MFFLVRGLISIEKMMKKEDKESGQIEFENTEIAQLKAGSYFGELALLRKGDRTKQRRAASCIALTDCDTRILRKTTFNTVCEDFPELRVYLQSEADRKYAAFSKPKASSKAGNADAETKEGPTKKKPIRRNSIAMALQQPGATQNENYQPERSSSFSSIKSRKSWTSVKNIVGSGKAAVAAAAAAAGPTVANGSGSGFDFAGLQTTLDSINRRMARLEVNMSRLQAKSNVVALRPESNGVVAIPGGVTVDTGVTPPPNRGSRHQHPTGSSGRRILTSAPLTSPTGAVLGGGGHGWQSLRDHVLPAEAEAMRQSPTNSQKGSPIRRVDSGFSWQ